MKMIVEELIRNDQRTYPYIGIVRETPHKGGLVLFTGPSKGTVIRNASDGWWEVGRTLDSWNENCFDVFYGTITVKP